MAEALLRLATHWGSDGRLTDLLGNIALFAPLGFAGVLVLRSAVGTVLICIVFAMILQIAQLWVPSRIAAMNDVFWNGVGAAAGAFAAGSLSTRWVRSRLEGVELLPAGLLLLWLAAEALPLVPGLGWQEFKDSIKPLWQGPGWRAGQFFAELSMALAALEILGRIYSGPRLVQLAVVGLAGVLALKVAVMDRVLDLSTVSAFMCAGLIWLRLRRGEARRRQVWLVSLLLIGYTLEALLPLYPAATLGTFHWVPFASMLNGSLLDGAINGARLLFTFAALLWLLRLGGSRTMQAAVPLAVWVLLLELAQLLLQGHTSDVTPVLLVFAAALGVRLFASHTISVAQDRPSAASDSTPARRKEVAPVSREVSTRQLLLATVALVVAVSVMLQIAVRLPGVPYNVRELFRGSSMFPWKVLFVVALLWLGAGPALVAQRFGSAKHAWFKLPAMSMLVGVASLALFAASVSNESLADIAGSNNLNWFVIHRQIWGHWAAVLFARMDSPGVVGFFERIVRYTALFGPLFMTLALFGMAPVANGQKHSDAEMAAVGGRRHSLVLAM